MHDQVEQSLQKRLIAFEELCRGKGLKLTHQRLEIYRELLASPDHPSVETVFQRVRKRIPTIALDTVYRTLAMLEESGMINRLQASGGLARFEPDSGIHHHLICNKCHKIDDFVWEEFDSLAVPAVMAGWGSVETRNIVVEGICKSCLKKQKKS